MSPAILSNQNNPENIKLLKASSVAYKKAKVWEVLITYVLLALALLYPVCYVYSNNEKIKLTLFICSFFLAVFIQIFQDTFKGNTSKGALFKEEFDVLLFNLPWKTTLNKPDYAEVSKLSLEYKGPDIKDWYSTSVSTNIPDNAAIAIFQRINTGWDIDLRKKYCNWLRGSMIIYTMWLFIFFIYYKVDGETIFLIAFSILAFYTHLLNLLSGHTSVIEKRKSISERLDNIILKKKHITTIELRDIQDEIYITRKEPAKVPNFFFKLYKKKMDAEFEDYIETVNNVYK